MPEKDCFGLTPCSGGFRRSVPEDGVVFSNRGEWFLVRPSRALRRQRAALEDAVIAMETSKGRRLAALWRGDEG